MRCRLCHGPIRELVKGVIYSHDGRDPFYAGKQMDHDAEFEEAVMTKTEEEKLQKDIDYWRCEALIAEEQGDTEMAKKYFEQAAVYRRILEDLRIDNLDH